MAKPIRRDRKRKPDKPPRKYGRIDDRGLLRIIKSEGLACDKSDGTIYRVREDVRKEIPQLPDPRDRGYFFVYVYHKGCRRKIAVHRLVWMIVERRLIPNGCDVHHRDTDKSNNAFENLEPQDYFRHRSEAGKKGAAVTNAYPADWDDVDLDDGDSEPASVADDDYAFNEAGL